MHVLVAAVAQCHDERPRRSPPTRIGVRDQTELAEVDLRKLARITVGPAHGDPPSVTEAAVLDREAVQRAVRHIHTPASEQLVHLRELQATLLRRARLQPLLDLVPVT